jgi:hypothetical protein
MLDTDRLLMFYLVHMKAVSQGEFANVLLNACRYIKIL